MHELQQRKRIRAAAVAAIVSAAMAASGCVVQLPQPTPPQPMPLPSNTAAPQPTDSPSATNEANEPASGTVEPDEPVTETDTTELDSGVLYAGERPVTSSGYLPDAATNVILPPTHGVPLFVEGIAGGDQSEGVEYLAARRPNPANDLVGSTVGRLVMTDTDGSEYTCTATVINSATDNIAVTAAHCLFSDETSNDFEKIVFAPAYRDGEAPLGEWEALDWWYPEQYIESNRRWLAGDNDNGWMGFDFGFLRFGPQDGREIEEVTGGQGVSFTAETHGVLVAGYPGNAPFDAESMRYCTGSEPNYGFGGDPNYGIDCAMGEGASGSGWLSNLDPGTGAGTITAVYSNGGSSDAYGPPLGVTAYNGLREIENR